MFYIIQYTLQLYLSYHFLDHNFIFQHNIYMHTLYSHYCTMTNILCKLGEVSI